MALMNGAKRNRMLCPRKAGRACVGKYGRGASTCVASLSSVQALRVLSM